MVERDPSSELKAENARLIALLEANGFSGVRRRSPCRQLQRRSSHGFPPTGKWRYFAGCFAGVRMSTLFVGRARLRPSRATPRPCANEWRAGVCEKPRIKCGDCSNRMLIPLSDSVIFDHLAGEQTVGVYPLLEDDTCYFVAIDFDEAE